MATKKRKKTSSAPVRRHSVKRIKTRRKSRRKGGMLSEFSLSNPAMTGAIKGTFSGALGGVTAGLIQKMMANQSTGMQIGGLLLGSAVASWGLKAPNFGAGIAGASGLLIASELGMLSEGSEDSRYNWANQMKALPMFLDENGNTMLAESYQPGWAPDLSGL